MRALKDLMGFLESEIEIIESEIADCSNEEFSIKLKALTDIFDFISDYNLTLEYKKDEVKK
ncbi:MAG: hypothetical protein Q7T77_07085 [Sulfuricurvum sp.]|nr:hypothetical protein [Sulfuricurvum sp.]